MDKEKSSAISELNTFLKGEYMAISSYEKYIQKLEDINAKNAMIKVLNRHRQHAIQLNSRIKQLGGTPIQSVGISGTIGEMMLSLKNIGAHSKETLCKKAFEGEKKGLNMAEEIVKGDLDLESAVLVKNIISQERETMQELEKYIIR
ncbi:DUF2383 domain-containing protein [Clostridium sp. 19966]|uniref:DUF2383 domain-containing protein n=1 Tax=Clostridium sp. 19966 TaxID=2768166 RepID=UPI0028E083F8|nr:DUF2383 domain-containing protein [Clostridium sp. 19966]MDT8715193.1 DUF2383 domain-containing protein [Clostridium sp. 19966]